MRRSVLALLLVAGCDREAAQRARCTEVAEYYLPKTWHPAQFIEQCVTDGWSEKQMTCRAQHGGMVGMFCDD